jgi:protocatechuate 3,4-dioxygenase beta subunit
MRNCGQQTAKELQLITLPFADRRNKEQATRTHFFHVDLMKRGDSMKKPHLLPLLFLITIWLAGCAQEAAAPPDSEEVTEATPVAAPTGEPLPETSETAPAEEAPVTPAEQAAVEQAPVQQATESPPTATPEPEPAEPTPAAIEVTYFTPPQGQGPYYPVNKLDDRDNDLTVLEGAAGVPAGQIVEFDGVVYDAGGIPRPGVLIEIWQTDESGVYLHPGDPGTEQRDVNFQFYGEALSAADGSYSFRTILPGRYEPRPRHIHVKVKYEGQELLTTQFYFADDPELAGESMFAQVGDEGAHLVISLKEGQDGDGKAILTGRRDIVLNTDF